MLGHLFIIQMAVGSDGRGQPNQPSYTSVDLENHGFLRSIIFPKYGCHFHSIASAVPGSGMQGLKTEGGAESLFKLSCNGQTKAKPQGPECPSQQPPNSGGNTTNPVKQYHVECSWDYFWEGKLELSEKWFWQSTASSPCRQEKRFKRHRLKKDINFFPPKDFTP